MKTRIEIDTETQDFRVVYLTEDGVEDFEASNRNEEALRDSMEFLRDVIVNDLKDIWKRLDRLEDRDGN